MFRFGSSKGIYAFTNWHWALALDTNNLGNKVSLDVLVQLLAVNDAKLRIIHISNDGQVVFKKDVVLPHYQRSLQEVDHTFHVFYDENTNDGISEFMDSTPVDLLPFLYRVH